MKKKVIAILVSAMMLATVLAGCGAAPAAPAAEPDAKEETTEVAEVKTDATEEAEEAEEAHEVERVGSIADDLIRTAGLDSEPEEIEPAEPVGDDEVSAKLAQMYSSSASEPAEEEKPAGEEKPAAPTSFNDMMNALFASNARVKNKK